VEIKIDKRIALSLKAGFFELINALNNKILRIAYSIMCNIKVSLVTLKMGSGINGNDDK